jgi:uncharacterized membrane protein YdjX (TVP38/TMEM64 family)
MKTSRSLVWYQHGLGTLLLCLAFGLIISNVGLFDAFNQTWIDRDIRDAGLSGAVYFLSIGALVTACGAPRQIVAFMGGYAFGFSLGALLATLAAILGCVAAFYFSRLFSRNILRSVSRRKFAIQANRVNHFLSQQPTRKTIIIRLLPVGSNIITNLVAGATDVSAKAFFIGSAIGYIPQMLVFALLGKGLLIGSEWKIALSVILLLISSLLSFSIYRKYQREYKGDASKAAPVCNAPVNRNLNKRIV